MITDLRLIEREVLEPMPLGADPTVSLINKAVTKRILQMCINDDIWVDVPLIICNIQNEVKA